jgi:hypothetical protein
MFLIARVTLRDKGVAFDPEFVGAEILGSLVARRESHLIAVLDPRAGHLKLPGVHVELTVLTKGELSDLGNLITRLRHFDRINANWRC